MNDLKILYLEDSEYDAELAGHYLKEAGLHFNFKLVAKLEKTIDETVKHYYDVQNAMHIYERFKGFPIIYGLHFRRI